MYIKFVFITRYFSGPNIFQKPIVKRNIQIFKQYGRRKEKKTIYFLY